MSEDVDQFGRSNKEKKGIFNSNNINNSEKIKESLAEIKEQLIKENFKIEELVEPSQFEERTFINKENNYDKIKQLEDKINILEKSISENINNKLNSINQKISNLNKVTPTTQNKIDNNIFFELGSQLKPLKSNAVLVIEKETQRNNNKFSFYNLIYLILAFLIIYSSSVLIMLYENPYSLNIFGKKYLIKFLEFFNFI